MIKNFNGRIIEEFSSKFLWNGLVAKSLPNFTLFIRIGRSRQKQKVGNRYTIWKNHFLSSSLKNFFAFMYFEYKIFGQLLFTKSVGNRDSFPPAHWYFDYFYLVFVSFFMLVDLNGYPTTQNLNCWERAKTFN